MKYRVIRTIFIEVEAENENEALERAEEENFYSWVYLDDEVEEMDV